MVRVLGGIWGVLAFKKEGFPIIITIDNIQFPITINYRNIYRSILLPFIYTRNEAAVDVLELRLFNSFNLNIL